MSSVTNVILTHHAIEGTFNEAIKKINVWLMEHARGTLIECSEYAGGTKRMECYVYMGAFNFLDEHAFQRVVAEAPWQSPEDINLLLKSQGDDRFEDVTSNKPWLDVWNREIE